MGRIGIDIRTKGGDLPSTVACLTWKDWWVLCATKADRVMPRRSLLDDDEGVEEGVGEGVDGVETRAPPRPPESMLR